MIHNWLFPSTLGNSVDTLKEFISNELFNNLRANSLWTFGKTSLFKRLTKPVPHIMIFPANCIASTLSKSNTKTKKQTTRTCCCHLFCVHLSRIESHVLLTSILKCGDPPELNRLSSSVCSQGLTTPVVLSLQYLCSQAHLSQGELSLAEFLGKAIQNTHSEQEAREPFRKSSTNVTCKYAIPTCALHFYMWTQRKSFVPKYLYKQPGKSSMFKCSMLKLQSFRHE